jgi:hypothetical protein
MNKRGHFFMTQRGQFRMAFDTAPLGEIRCEILEATAPALRKFDPPRLLSAFRNSSGYLILDGTYTDAGEPQHPRPLGPGTYRIRVRGDYYQDGEFQLQWPPAAAANGRIPVPQPGDPNSLELLLLPGAAYPLPDVTVGRLQLGPTILRGSAFGADGTPVENALAEVINFPPFDPPLANLPALQYWPFLSARAGAGGDWALVLPGRRYFDNTPEIPPPIPPILRRQVAVRIHYPTGPVTTVEDVVLGGEHSVRNTALRGQVLGPGGRPIAGARIRTSVDATTSTSCRDGSWFLYFNLNQASVPNVTVTVTAPNGPSATSAATLQRHATVVVPTFNLP